MKIFLLKKSILSVVLALVLALAVVWGAYAAFAPTNISTTGTITITEDYSVSVSPATLNFGAVSGTVGDPITTVNVGVTLTNDGSVEITGFRANCDGITGLPAGLSVALTTASTAVPPGGSIALNFQLSGTPTATVSSGTIAGNIVLNIQPST